MANKYGNEKLADAMTDAILDFVNSTIDHQMDQIDISEKAQDAVDYAAKKLDWEDYISDFDWSNVINSDLILQNVDLDAVFSDWIQRRFERQYSSIFQDLESKLESLEILIEQRTALADPKPSLWARISSWFQNVIKNAWTKK